jgi:ferredoxin-type protein NapH
MDPRLLEYDFDEEAEGFGRPRAPLAKPSTGAGAPLRRVAQALVGLGLLSLVVQMAGGPLAGSWAGLLSSLGAMSVGAAATFWLASKDEPAGIRNDGVWFSSLLARGTLAWIAGVGMTGFYVLIYWFPALLGVGRDGAPNTGLVHVVDPLSMGLKHSPASEWTLYGVLYSLAVAVFAVRTGMKYRHNRYQLVRTGSVTFFQLVFAFLLPGLLERFQKPYMEFNGLWPLKADYLVPYKVTGFLEEPSGLGKFLLAWILVASLIAVPLLTYRFGKRWYCSWVCGCGGLAETLGDPWRQLSSKSDRAWKIERVLIHSVAVVVVVMTLGLWLSRWAPWAGFSYTLKAWYGFAIGAVFSGVVGVGFYPLLGNRVWCRFGCPQAAILGVLQRCFSRFRITTNGDQCMSCGNCSTYCEMGIDVRAYASRGENIVRASCVGCGVCAAVCPRGVLKLENGGTHADRFEGSREPLDVLRKSISEQPRTR